MNLFLISFLAVALASVVLMLSSLRSLKSKSLTTNLVGMTWFWLTCFKKALTPVFLMNFFLLILLLISLGFLAMPATNKCGNLCFLFPSSCTLVTMAFLPANLPEVNITTLPVLKLNKVWCTFYPFYGCEYYNYKYLILFDIKLRK